MLSSPCRVEGYPSGGILPFFALSCREGSVMEQHHRGGAAPSLLPSISHLPTAEGSTSRWVFHWRLLRVVAFFLLMAARVFPSLTSGPLCGRECFPRDVACAQPRRAGRRFVPFVAAARPGAPPAAPRSLLRALCAYHLLPREPGSVWQAKELTDRQRTRSSITHKVGHAATHFGWLSDSSGRTIRA